MNLDPPTRSRLLDLLSRADPRRVYLGLELVEKIESGWETHLYHLRAGVEENSGKKIEDLVLRCHDGAGSRQKARAEYHLLSRLAKLGVRVPSVRALIQDKDFVLSPCLVMEFVEGPTAEQKLRDASSADLRGEISRLVDPLVRLHRLPWTPVIQDLPISGSSSVDENSGIESRISATERSLIAIEIHEFAPVIDWLRQHAPEDRKLNLALCHNDYHPGNIIIEPGGRLTILDWSFAAIDDYRLDLAWSVLLFGTQLGTEFRPAVLQAYEQLSGSRVQHFEYFEMLKLADRLAALATWLSGDVEPPVRKITPQAMRSNYRVHVMNVYRRLVEISGIRLATFESL